MSRYSAGKLRLWFGQPVNAPYATPPASLRAMVIVCIISATGTLVAGVANQLALGGSATSSFQEAAVFVGCYFLLPILIAHTIATNWPISRILICAYVFTITYQVFFSIDGLRTSTEYRAFAMAGLFLFVLSSLWWLFGSKKMRLYYSLVMGQGLPSDLEGPIDELIAPGRAERLFGRFAKAVAPFFEGAVIVLVIVGLIFALSVYK
ncbi:MAG: hypothetical protein K0U72_10085 [Gammaproteobacteria bacterium]|nr:hypothetical protein [Gammaproteobacteria bacterium]